MKCPQMFEKDKAYYGVDADAADVGQVEGDVGVVHHRAEGIVDVERQHQCRDDENLP